MGVQAQYHAAEKRLGARRGAAWMTALVEPVVAWIPWVPLGLGLLALAASVLVSTPTDAAALVMYSSGMLTAAVALFTFQILEPDNRRVLGMLADRGVLAPNAATIAPTVRFRVLTSLALIVLFGTLVYWWWLYEERTSLVAWSSFALELVIAVVLGWRASDLLFGFAAVVWTLGAKRGIRPQLGNPDACGGLEPLGDLCLRHALIPSIGWIYLLFWILVGAGLMPADAAKREVAAHWMPVYSLLLVVPVGITLVTFFVPLISVHRAMAEDKWQHADRLNDLSRQIGQLTKQVTDTAGTADSAQIKESS